MIFDVIIGRKPKSKRKMKIFGLIISCFFVLGNVNAQVGIGAGGSVLAGFSGQGAWGGLHLTVEIPRDDATSMYGRITHHFKKEAAEPILAEDFLVYIEPRDPTSGLPIEYIGATPSMNYTILEGGTRYYIGSGFDFGWAAYGGGNMMLVFNSVKIDYDPYDEGLYVVNEASRMDGTIFGFGFGLGGGVKYTNQPIGTFYFDLNMNYMLFAQANTDFIYGDMYSSLIFNFNLGFRKDILW